MRSLVTAIRKWSILSGALGGLVLLAGLWQRGRAASESIEAESAALMIVEGFALLVLVVGMLLLRRPLASLLDSDHGHESSGDARHRDHPYMTMFAVSFVVLFVEVMLIRYCSSQIRIFAFYKNVPLISAFLGLGLGCWLGGGRARHALLFMVWLVPLSVFLSAGALAVDGVLSHLAAAGSSEHILGAAITDQQELSASEALTIQVMMAAFCVATLVAITLLFAFLGRLLGEAFEGLPRVPAYTVNIVGSLVGILGFVAASYLQTPPWAWFIVGLVPLLWWLSGRKAVLAACALIAVNAAAVLPTVGETVWSRYQKLVGQPAQFQPVTTGTPSDVYLLQISDVFYQVALDLRPDAVARMGRNPYPHYDEVYRQIGSPDRVLIVGVGMGNDVAAALRAGVRQVDAVDIDPAIVELGIQNHPEQPYDDPRVTLIINDARDAFRRLESGTYDAVVFGLLDSHTQLGTSSVRLDNYVFTLESFEAASRLLKPGGHIVVTAASFRDWFRDRITAMLEATCDGPVTVHAPEGEVWYTYIGRVDGGSLSGDTSTASIVIPTDDWPFLYLPRRAMPQAYVVMVLLLAIASVVVLRKGGLEFGRFSSYHGHMFLLGAAFLLMEVHAVNRLALLFGTTWLVSAFTIALVLTLIVAANLTIWFVRSVPYGLAYTLLFASLVASAWFQPGMVLGHGLAIELAYGLLLLSPIYFAGLIFARSFKVATIAGPAIGANILGSVLGGWVEYSTMIFGVRAMVLLALVLYAGSLVCLMIGIREPKAVTESAGPTA